MKPTIHTTENNAVSESILHDRTGTFKTQCLTIIAAMVKGVKVNQDWALNRADKILRLASRIHDISSKNEVPISKQFKKDESGKKLYMEYFIEENHRADIAKRFNIVL